MEKKFSLEDRIVNLLNLWDSPLRGEDLTRALSKDFSNVYTALVKLGNVINSYTQQVSLAGKSYSDVITEAWEYEESILALKILDHLFIHYGKNFYGNIFSEVTGIYETKGPLSFCLSLQKEEKKINKVLKRLCIEGKIMEILTSTSLSYYSKDFYDKSVWKCKESILKDLLVLPYITDKQCPRNKEMYTVIQDALVELRKEGRIKVFGYGQDDDIRYCLVNKREKLEAFSEELQFITCDIAFNAYHFYRVVGHVREVNRGLICYPSHDTQLRELLKIKFQKGSIKEHGVNGVQNEDLISIVIDRLQDLQEGDYSCTENALALKSLREAKKHLLDRRNNRSNNS